MYMRHVAHIHELCLSHSASPKVEGSHTHTHTRTHTHIHTHTHTYSNTHAQQDTRTVTHTYRNINAQQHTRTATHTYFVTHYTICTHTHMYIHTHIHIHWYICKYAATHVNHIHSSWLKLIFCDWYTQTTTRPCAALLAHVLPHIAQQHTHTPWLTYIFLDLHTVRESLHSSWLICIHRRLLTPVLNSSRMYPRTSRSNTHTLSGIATPSAA